MVPFQFVFHYLFHYKRKNTLGQIPYLRTKNLNTSNNDWDFSAISGKQQCLGFHRTITSFLSLKRKRVRQSNHEKEPCEASAPWMADPGADAELWLWTLGAFHDFENKFDSYFWHCLLTSKVSPAKRLHGDPCRRSSPALCLSTSIISQGDRKIDSTWLSATVHVLDLIDLRRNAQRLWNPLKADSVSVSIKFYGLRQVIAGSRCFMSFRIYLFQNFGDHHSP